MSEQAAYQRKGKENPKRIPDPKAKYQKGKTKNDKMDAPVMSSKYRRSK